MATPKSRIDRINQTLEPLAEWMGIAGGLMVVILMFMITFDAIGRKLGQPIPGSLEASEAIMVGVVFLPLMYVQMRREHVYVVIATQWLPARGQAALDALAALVGLGLFLLATYLGADRAWNSTVIGEFRAGMIFFPIWPFRWFIPIGTGFMSLQLLLTLLEELQSAFLGVAVEEPGGELGPDVGEILPEGLV